MIILLWDPLGRFEVERAFMICNLEVAMLGTLTLSRWFESLDSSSRRSS